MAKRQRQEGLEKFGGWDSPAGGFEVLAGVGRRESAQDVRARNLQNVRTLVTARPLVH